MEQDPRTEEFMEATHQAQTEFPMEGTALNPVESAWVFHSHPAAADPEDLAGAMPQGE